MEENHLTESQLLGRDGEQIAADYLVSAGYKIIERNWVCGRYEIDIICTKDDELVFVEVKSHNKNPFFNLGNMVNTEKQRKIIYSANKYIHLHRLDMNARFDIIEVTFSSDDEFEVNHIPDAFYVS